jgi:hypothetical protein
MKGNVGELMMMAIGGVVMFVVVKEVMGGQNTTLWSTLEITLFQTIIPLLAAVAVIFGIFKLMERIG